MKTKIIKTINDPVHGFINIRSELIYQLIKEPLFQRLRRINQLGLTCLVYPGALHTRFHHALGAMHLMEQALDTLISKGQEITPEEYEGALIAILLHDIGHGPFSHVLEFVLMKNVHHEIVSDLLMEVLNEKYQGALTIAQEIFRDIYPKKFLHQLVSSQLDMDRLDYLQRDCFFTGVYEGKIGGARIIHSLNVYDDELVVERKGIYSIEHFLNARRMMYWQVYLHKTNVSTEQMLIHILHRAKVLLRSGMDLPMTPALKVFMERDIQLTDYKSDSSLLEYFIQLDDSDIWGSIKFWMHSSDIILKDLCQRLLDRNVFRTELSSIPHDEEHIYNRKIGVMNALQLSEDELDFYLSSGSISNAAYLSRMGIRVLNGKGEVFDLAETSDLPNIKALTQIVKKYYLSYPKY